MTSILVQMSIDYFRHAIIFEGLNSQELKSMLDNTLTEIETPKDKVLLLEGIWRLQGANIDSFILGGQTDFFHYVKLKFVKWNIVDDKEIKWRELYKELYGKYINNCTAEDFIYVMLYKRVAIGSSKIVWHGPKADGMRFQRKMGFGLKEFNDCFVDDKGSTFKENNRQKTAPKQSFADLLEKYNN